MTRGEQKVAGGGLGLVVVLGCVSAAMAQTLPPASALPRHPEWPDPLVMLDGQPVTNRDQWNRQRRVELKRLFQHYMYGYFPDAPANLSARVESTNSGYFDGKATRKLVSIEFGPPGTPKIHLLLVIPNRRERPAPVFVGLNFCGNHTLVDDPEVPIPEVWMPARCPGCVDEKATEAGRGRQKDDWAIEQSIDRGYAVATCYAGDIDPDRNDFTDGVHPHYSTSKDAARNPHEWGTIAAWAWGLSRCVDYLVTDRDLDRSRIAVVGHSRMGKTALLAGAFDDRIALVIPHQAGCGGSAPSRKSGPAIEKAESVKKINTAFPHWFCDEFKQFNDQVERLPFDQHCLVALCAPRPVLLTNAVDDQWADPDGQFRVLQGADRVYRLLGDPGLEATEPPPPGKLIDGALGYYIRDGKHSMSADDWRVFLDYADKRFEAR